MQVGQTVLVEGGGLNCFATIIEIPTEGFLDVMGQIMIEHGGNGKNYWVLPEFVSVV